MGNYKIVAVRLENEIAMCPMIKIAETDSEEWAQYIKEGLKKTDMSSLFGFSYIEEKE